MNTAAIETRSLTKRYGTARGIENMDLRVEHGEVFGFLGPNGAGKTTTIRLLVDLLRPTSGSASVLGLDCRRDSLAVRRRVGFLPGDLTLYDHMDGTALIRFLSSLRPGVDRGLVDRLVERFGIEMNRPIGSLSKGNRQKLGLLQAFMHRPQVLVLDEPTTGLDPLVQEEFHDLLREVAAEGTAVFLSSHSLDQVQRVADRVGIIREGRLVAVEAVDTLRRLATRHVRIEFTEPVAAGEFEMLDGVRDVRAKGTTVEMAVTGALGPLLGVVANHEVVDLLSEAADLEEIFLAYYRGPVDADTTEPANDGPANDDPEQGRP